MPRLDLSQRYRKILDAVFTEHVPELTVWAYGSRVSGAGHEGSDLDLVLYNPKDPDRRTENLSTVRAALSDSNLPILIDLMDWATLPDAFRAQIEACRVIFREGGRGYRDTTES